jgi:hypothetical protein
MNCTEMITQDRRGGADGTAEFSIVSPSSGFTYQELRAFLLRTFVQYRVEDGRHGFDVEVKHVDRTWSRKVERGHGGGDGAAFVEAHEDVVREAIDRPQKSRWCSQEARDMSGDVGIIQQSSLFLYVRLFENLCLLQ